MGKQSREKWARKNEIAEEKPSRIGFQTGLEKTCLFLIRWGTYLVLFTPLVINLKFFFPFVTPKTIFFRIIIEIILTAYIFLVIKNRHWRPRINALTLALALFLIIFILASFTGVNLSRSFWSTYERMTGILTMLHLFVFFIILSSVFKRREDWEKILGVSAAVGVILSLYILMGDQASTRGGGTIGNTSFMAAYLFFDIFFAIILFLSNLFKKEGWPLFWQIFSGLSLLIMLPVLFTSTAKGAIASFCGGLFLLFLGYLIFSQKKRLKRLALAIILLLVILAAALAVFQPPFVKEEAKVNLTEMKARFVVWEKGWKGFRERPILGWGPENFNNVFLKYFNPCMFSNECGGEIWFDRVHNIVLDTLVTIGIIGLLSYLSIFGIAIYELLRTASKVVERKNIFIPLGLTVLLLVYFVQNLLVFDMINTYLVFFLSLAFINFLIQKPIAEEKEVRVKSVNPILAFLIIILVIFILWSGNIQPIVANHYIIKTVGSQNIEEVSLFFQKSLNTWMEKYEPREYFTQKMYKSTYQEIPAADKEAFQKAFNLAESEMEKSIEQNYLDFRPHLFLGELYIGSYRLSGDQKELERGEQVLEKAIQLSPTNQQGYWNLAEAKLIQGKREEMILLLKKAVEIEPQVGYSHWYLSVGYQISGEYQLALEEAQKAKKNGYNWSANPEDLKKVMGLIQTLGGDLLSFFHEDDNRIIEYVLKLIEADPDYHIAWFYLAASYANQGQFKEARETAEKLLELDSSFAPQVKEFLETLPQ